MLASASLKKQRGARDRAPLVGGVRTTMRQAFASAYTDAVTVTFTAAGRTTSTGNQSGSAQPYKDTAASADVAECRGHGSVPADVGREYGYGGQPEKKALGSRGSLRPGGAAR